jgi:hypothetical protein
MAENHPVGFQWVMEARERGAQVIHVDPQFSRTSAMANIWAPLLAGSDILFLVGGCQIQPRERIAPNASNKHVEEPDELLAKCFSLFKIMERAHLAR